MFQKTYASPQKMVGRRCKNLVGQRGGRTTYDTYYLLTPHNKHNIYTTTARKAGKIIMSNNNKNNNNAVVVEKSGGEVGGKIIIIIKMEERGSKFSEDFIVFTQISHRKPDKNHSDIIMASIASAER